MAASIHDLEHPGVTNAYLTSVRSTLALRYNDKSPLENHHISQALQILQNDRFNIFHSFSEKEYQKIREQMIHYVLATDNQFHNSNLKELKEMTESEGWTVEELTG